MSTTRKLLSVVDVKGAWAIMPTPAKPDAGDWRAEHTVDLEEAARIANAMVEAGVDGILSLGTFGECATLSWEEKVSFIKVVVKAIDGRIPFFCGTTSLNTRETIRQTREAHELGVDGTMLGVPMWCAIDVPSAVQFYRDVASACPEMAICVYANNEAFKFDFPPSFWAQVAEIEQVICAKYLGVGKLDLDLQLTQKRIRFMPVDMDYYAAARIDPDFCTAFWSSGAACGPLPALALRNAVDAARKSNDWAEAHRISSLIGGTLQTLLPSGSFQEFSRYNIGLEKARMNAAGWLNAGPVRPPYQFVPEAYLEGARESGVRWRKLSESLE